MCDFLVFATHDITQEHWADFINAAALTDDLIGYADPNADPTPPYVMVHSRSQEDLNRTGDIDHHIRTEFESATYAEMQMFLDKIRGDKETARRIASTFFMVLDKNSEKDRKVVLICKCSRTLYKVVQDEDVRYDGAEDRIWRKYRIPFEKVAFIYLVFMSKPGDEGDEFLQNTTQEKLEGL